MSDLKRKPWMKFFPADWQADDGLRQCSLAARGLWIELIAIMHKSAEYGHLLIAGQSPTVEQVAISIGAPPKVVKLAMEELEHWRVFSRNEDGTVFCRRMIADHYRDVQDIENGMCGGNPEIRRGTVPKAQRQRRFRPSDNEAKAQRIFAKSSGHCHWCGTALQRDHAGPDRFHVDHLIAICDGGGNEDENLVASCAKCNHARSRIGASDPNPQCSPDPKAQKPEARVRESEKEDSPLVVPPTAPPPAVVKPPRAAGKRLPHDWQPDPSDADFARSLGLDPASVLAAFRDYWQGVPGQRGVKLDWPATWRNWCRNDRGAATGRVQRPAKLTQLQQAAMNLGLDPWGGTAPTERDWKGVTVQ